tara:strand:+ start:1080 stop:1232 length:153 start_codon:yes stop_codon:yes gene_type:complete
MIEILKEYFVYLKENKKLWMLPIILVLLFFGLLVIVSQGSALAPFIYTIF